MQTLADWKRELKTHADWTLHHSGVPARGGVPMTEPRTVEKVQSNGVWFTMPGGDTSWLDFPKAWQVSFPAPDSIRIETGHDAAGQLPPMVLTYTKACPHEALKDKTIS